MTEIKAFYHKDFNKCYQEIEVGEVDDVNINIISKDNLLINKEATARNKDLADIQSIKAKSYKGF